MYFIQLFVCHCRYAIFVFYRIACQHSLLRTIKKIIVIKSCLWNNKLSGLSQRLRRLPLNLKQIDNNRLGQHSLLFKLKTN